MKPLDSQPYVALTIAVIALVGLAALTAASAQPVDPSLGRVVPGVAAQQVGRCGFASVALSYDGLLAQYIVKVPGIQKAPDDQLRCAAKVSLDTDYYVDFRAPLNRRYEQVYWPVAEGEGRAAARDWLTKHGLLSKLPAYVPGKTDDLKYARQLEQLCGARAKGAFAIEQGALMVRAGTAAHPRIDAETFDCLMNAQWASGLPTTLAAAE